MPRALTLAGPRVIESLCECTENRYEGAAVFNDLSRAGVCWHQDAMGNLRMRTVLIGILNPSARENSRLVDRGQSY